MPKPRVSETAIVGLGIVGIVGLFVLGQYNFYWPALVIAAFHFVYGVRSILRREITLGKGRSYTTYRGATAIFMTIVFTLPAIFIGLLAAHELWPDVIYVPFFGEHR